MKGRRLLQLDDSAAVIRKSPNDLQLVYESGPGDDLRSGDRDPRREELFMTADRKRFYVKDLNGNFSEIGLSDSVRWWRRIWFHTSYQHLDAGDAYEAWIGMIIKHLAKGGVR